MSPPPAPSCVGYGALRELPLKDLVAELDRVERLLAEHAGPSAAVTPVRDLAVDALRSRERALVAEIRRRPGGVRFQPVRTLVSASRPA